MEIGAGIHDHTLVNHTLFRYDFFVLAGEAPEMSAQVRRGCAAGEGTTTPLVVGRGAGCSWASAAWVCGGRRDNDTIVRQVLGDGTCYYRIHVRRLCRRSEFCGKYPPGHVLCAPIVAPWALAPPASVPAFNCFPSSAFWSLFRAQAGKGA